MALRTCPDCSQLLRVFVPERDEEIGDHPVRLPFHRYPTSWAICRSAGRTVRVLADGACGRCGKGTEGEHTYDCLDGAA